MAAGMMAEPDQYTVFGHPIAHSRSPEVHAHFARQTGEPIRYDKRDPGEQGFEQAVERFFREGGWGANVTLPFKVRAARLADRQSSRALAAGSANTLKREADGRLLADNTDGPGLVRDLRDNLGFSLRGARTVMLGAGGAARGVLAPLLEAGIESLHLANRTVARAQALAEQHRRDALVTAGPLDPLPAGGFDLIINATSASVHGQGLALSESLLREQTLCYDMAYAEGPTPFTAWAAEYKAAYADGWGMMVEQAAESFQLWRGVRPDTQSLVRDRGLIP